MPVLSNTTMELAITDGQGNMITAYTNELCAVTVLTTATVVVEPTLAQGQARRFISGHPKGRSQFFR